MNTIDDYLDQKLDVLSSELREEIDFEIIRKLLVESGWTTVVRKYPMTMDESQELDIWIEQNCKHKVKNRGLVWIFEKAQDANWFALRWL